MFRISVAFLVASHWLFGSVACAAIPETALRAYRTGAYERAAQVSESEGSAASFAFAAQAVIADAISRKDGFCTPCLAKAEQLAERAISLDPRLIDGYLQSAVAVGFRGRSIGLTEARAEGLAEEAKDRLDKAMAIDPTNVWARASLGAWNLEIVHHAGKILASLMYGASQNEGLALYRTALGDAPAIAVLHFHFALSILALDPDEFRAEAERELRHTLSISVDDALTKHVQSQASTMLKAMQTSSPRELEEMVKRFQGYPPDISD